MERVTSQSRSAESVHWVWDGDGERKYVDRPSMPPTVIGWRVIQLIEFVALLDLTGFSLRRVGLGKRARTRARECKMSVETAPLLLLLQIFALLLDSPLAFLGGRVLLAPAATPRPATIFAGSSFRSALHFCVRSTTSQCACRCHRGQGCAASDNDRAADGCI